MKKIALVTGGAGFIGSHMVDLLIEENFSVRIIDNLSSGDLRNIRQHANNPDVVLEKKNINEYQPNDLIFRDVSYVFHFAGLGDIVPSIESPYEYISTNLLGTVKMLECSRYAGVEKFIYAASSSCYGLAKTPTNEEHAIETLYPYALSKFQGEQAAIHWFNVYNLPVNSIRIFNAYGIRSRTSGTYGAVFGVFLKQKIEKKPFTVVGDGNQSRDFLYVTDVVKAFLLAAKSKFVGKIYNLGAGKPQTINYLVELLGGDSVFIPKRPGEPDCTWADITKISMELNWRPSISFESGVKLILKDIDYWNTAPLWEPQSISNATKTWFQYMSKR